MDGSLDDLDGRIISRLDSHVGRQRDLRQTEAVARIGGVARADDLEDGQHGQRVVDGHVAEPEVDVDERMLVPGEPAGLHGDGAAGRGPFCAVAGDVHAAAWTMEHVRRC